MTLAREIRRTASQLVGRFGREETDRRLRCFATRCARLALSLAAVQDPDLAAWVDAAEAAALSGRPPEESALPDAQTRFLEPARGWRQQRAARRAGGDPRRAPTAEEYNALLHELAVAACVSLAQPRALDAALEADEASSSLAVKRANAAARQRLRALCPAESMRTIPWDVAADRAVKRAAAGIPRDVLDVLRHSDDTALRAAACRFTRAALEAVPDAGEAVFQGLTAAEGATGTLAVPDSLTAALATHIETAERERDAAWRHYDTALEGLEDYHSAAARAHVGKAVLSCLSPSARLAVLGCYDPSFRVLMDQALHEMRGPLRAYLLDLGDMTASGQANPGG